MTIHQQKSMQECIPNYYVTVDFDPAEGNNGEGDAINIPVGLSFYIFDLSGELIEKSYTFANPPLRLDVADTEPLPAYIQTRIINQTRVVMQCVNYTQKKDQRAFKIYVQKEVEKDVVQIMPIDPEVVFDPDPGPGGDGTDPDGGN